MELENPLNLSEERLLKITVKGHWGFSVKSVISRIQSISGTVRPSRDIHRLNSKVVIFLSISTSIDRQSSRQYNMKMWLD